jgi:hypothetical protein
MAYTVEVKYFNSFWLKKVTGNSLVNSNTGMSTWPGLPWQPMVLNPTASPTLMKYPFFPWGDNEGGTDPAITPPVATYHGCAVSGTYQPWYIEEARIRGGYNNTNVSYGVRAYIVEEDVAQQHRANTLIYSGIYNSRTGINNTNVFSVSDAITKSADPSDGSIQRLFAEETNITVFQEFKVSRALIDKDTIYTSESGTQTQAAKEVIGQIVPYVGEFGIGTNPESLGAYGYRKYFLDRNRGAVLRLSNDGITEISAYGMVDYFRDYLSTISDTWQPSAIAFTFSLPLPTASQHFFDFELTLGVNPYYVCATCCSIKPGMRLIVNDGTNDVDTGIIVAYVDSTAGCRAYLNEQFIVDDTAGSGTVYTSGKFVEYIKSKTPGGWDIHNKSYILSLQPKGRLNCKTNTSGEHGQYNTLGFDEQINGWVSFYSYHPSFIDSLQNKFYTFISNSIYEHYDETTLNNRGSFYGTQNDSSITFIFNPDVSRSKNFLTINYEGSNGWEVDSFVSDLQEPDQQAPSSIPPGNGWVDNFDKTAGIYSYEAGAYIENGVTYRAGFDRKENKYTANLVNDSLFRPGEVVSGSSVSGIKGYFATVKVSTDSVTEVGGMKELYAVSSTFVNSSY